MRVCVCTRTIRLTPSEGGECRVGCGVGGGGIVWGTVARVAGDVQRAEGKTTWLLVGLIVLVFVAVPFWIRFGGAASGSLPPAPANPVAILEEGQKIAFAAGDLAVGDGLACEAGGLVVGAWVPKPGHTSNARLVNGDATSTASIKIQARDDGVVIVRCS